MQIDPQPAELSSPQDPYSVSDARHRLVPVSGPLKILGRAARGAVRLALVVAANVVGVFVFAGALFSAIDLLYVGTCAGAVVGVLTWIVDTAWLFLRLTLSERTTASPRI